MLLLIDASRVKVLQDAVCAAGEEAEVVHASARASGLRLPLVSIAAGAPNPGVEAALALGEPVLCGSTLERLASPPGTALSSLSETTARRVVAQLRCEGGLAGQYRAPASLLNAMRCDGWSSSGTSRGTADLCFFSRTRSSWTRRRSGRFSSAFARPASCAAAGATPGKSWSGSARRGCSSRDSRTCTALLHWPSLTAPAPSDVLVVATFILSKAGSFFPQSAGTQTRRGPRWDLRRVDRRDRG